MDQNILALKPMRINRVDKIMNSFKTLLINQKTDYRPILNDKTLFTLPYLSCLYYS
jgi:hypothetical protein